MEDGGILRGRSDKVFETDVHGFDGGVGMQVVRREVRDCAARGGRD